MRDIWSAHSRPERPINAVIGVRRNRQARAVIEQGRRVFDFATLVLPEAAMSHMRETGDGFTGIFGSYVAVAALVANAPIYSEKL